MNFLRKAADFFGLSDDEAVEYEVVSAAVEATDEVVSEPIQSAPQKKVKVSENYQFQAPVENAAPVQEEKVVPIHQPVRSQTVKRTPGRSRSESLDTSGKITILEPRNYNEIQTIAKRLLNGEAVLINFHQVDEDQARRIVDFLTGAVYAQDGDIKRVGDEIFLCTPKGVEIEGAASVYGETADVFEV